MKKQNLILLSLLLVTVFFINSCVTKPVSQAYPEKWEKTYIGMPLEEFKQLWPDAKMGQDFQGNLIFSQAPPIVIYSFDHIKIAYFTFKDNILVSIIEQ